MTMSRMGGGELKNLIQPISLCVEYMKNRPGVLSVEENMVIDIHAHIWAGRVEKDKQDLIKACELYDITKVYVCGLNGYYPDSSAVTEINNEVWKFMKERPEHIGGFCYINPANGNSLDELKRGIEDYGMSGMKLWVATLCDEPCVFPIVEKCIEYRIPILIHTWRKASGQLEKESMAENAANLARMYPEAKLIMAHLGGNCYYGIKPIADCKNVWVDFSGSVFRRDEIDYTRKLVGADRILFGTDMPGSYLINYGQVEEADLTDEEREKIYYKNALRILARN